MKFTKMRKKQEQAKKVLFGSLAALILGGTSLSNQLVADANQRSISEEVQLEAEALWEMMFDETYEGYEFDLTDEQRAEIWKMLAVEASEYVANLSEDEWAEIQRRLEEERAAEKYFWENLSPELLWEMYVEENPQVLRMRSSQVSEIKVALNGLYEEISVSDGESMINGRSDFQEISPFVYSWAGVPQFWQGNFSTYDGLGLVTRTALNTIGVNANTTANQAFASTDMRRDGFRHWLWNFNGVRDITVGTTAAGRQNSTRTFTTNRELGTAIARHNPSLNTTNPTNAQITEARRIRTNMLAMNFNAWNSLMNDASGRDDMMDLWNNRWGREDGRTTTATTLQHRFQQRWDMTGNEGLVRGNGTGATAMPLARRQHLFNNNWHRPW